MTQVFPMRGRCDHDYSLDGPAWTRTLWVALIANAAMFVTEVAAGLVADSSSLQADSLDFFGDSANYAISLGVSGTALAWRARAAFLKGVTLFALGLWVMATTVLHVYNGTLPKAEFMGIVGVIGLLTNGSVALLLYRFRDGDANMRSAWICSRYDVIGNIAVMLAAADVFGTGTGWADMIVAAIMATLSISGGWQISRHALSELREGRSTREFGCETCPDSVEVSGWQASERS
jgi:Co/Zn/Cd efflux system component